MTAKVHRKRGLEIDPEETPPLHFGHKLRADHMITGLSKGSDGESCCLVVLDDYSGAFAAYPQAKRDTDSNIRCLQHFGGTRAHGKALCQVKADCAEELKGAVEYLGWLPDPSVPNDQIHNPVTERKIRSIKETARAVQLKSGLPHQFWPRSVEYVCAALAVSTNAAIHPNDSDDVKNLKATQNAYEAASGGDAFTGLKLPFGCLVFYKPAAQASRASGLRAEDHTAAYSLAGYNFRGTHLVLDFESLRKNTQGCGKPIQVYETELVEPSNGRWVFPLFEAEQQRLQLFSAKSTPPSISTRKALPFDDEVPDPVPRRKRTYVTLERAIKFGRTPGCKGCERISEGVPHSDACHDRFRVLLEDERLAQEAKAKAREEAAARGYRCLRLRLRGVHRYLVLLDLTQHLRHQFRPLQQQSSH